MLLDWGMQRIRPSSCVHMRGGVHGGRSCSVTKNTAALVFQVRLMLAALNHLRSVRLDELVSGKACTTKLWPKVCRHSKPALPIECNGSARCIGPRMPCCMSARRTRAAGG